MKSNSKFTTVWKGKTEYFDEIVDALETAGIKCQVDKPNHTIKVPIDKNAEANGILMEINNELNACW